MKHYYIAGVIFFILILAGCSSGKKHQPPDEISGYETISSETANEMMQEGSLTIVDVRTKEEYEEGHMDQALLIPNETIADEIPAELPDLNDVILVYCRTGRRSAQAAGKLSAMGYTNIYNLDGGITAWPYTVTVD